MPGLTDWFDVFRCGYHVDRFGRNINITEADIDKAIKAYQPDSAPIVIGHPTLNAPAYGWVGAFRRIGPTVQARASSVADEFANIVKRHLYKNRSLSFGPGLNFRHVGFLGAQPPAVKGLADIQFSTQEEIMSVDYSEPEVAAETKAEPPAAPADNSPASTEKVAETHETIDLETVKAELAALKAENVALAKKSLKIAADLESERNKARHSEFSAFTQELVKTGKLSQDKQDQVVEFMESISSADTYEFSSGSELISKRFQGLLNELLRPSVDFAEMNKEPASAFEGLSSSELSKLLKDYIAEEAKKGRRISPSVAYSELSKKGRKGNAQSSAC